MTCIRMRYLAGVGSFTLPVRLRSQCAITIAALDRLKSYTSEMRIEPVSHVIVVVVVVVVCKTIVVM